MNYSISFFVICLFSLGSSQGYSDGIDNPHQCWTHITTQVENMTIKGASGSGVYCGLGADITIKKCVFTENHNGVKVYNNANPVITDSIFNNNERGITIENNSAPEISSEP